MALIKFPNRTVNTDAVNPFVNSVFDNLFTDSFLTDRMVTRVPAVNITETETGYEVELAAPGLQKGDFSINVDKNIMSISVEKKEESEETKKSYTKKEYSYTSFTRSFTLPDTVDYQKISASYENGILVISIGKKEDAVIAKRAIEVV